MKQIKTTLFIFSLALLISCEDKIDLTLDQGFEQITVEAVLNTDTTTQRIVLRGSVPFFDDINTTPAIDNANVFITNGSDTFNFTFIDKGEYWFNPSSTNRFEVGKSYELFVTVANETYTAASTPTRTAQWDSLTYDFVEQTSFSEEGYYLFMQARDWPGVGDAYWVRKYINGEFINAPEDINIALDGGTTQGEFDGEQFIFPISQGTINNFEEPLQLGDSVRIEVQGITPDFYFFMEEIETQMDNGGLFASPPANVRTNLTNMDPGGRKPLGYFIIGEMEAREVVIR